MSTTLSLRSADLRRLLDVTSSDHLGGAPDHLTVVQLPHPMPATVFEAIHRLIPCDQICYAVLDPYARQWVGWQQLLPQEDAGVSDDFFWRAYWSSPVCGRPQLTGDRLTATRSADFMTRGSQGATLVRELFDAYATKHQLLLPLAAEGPIDHRIELWRDDGQGFTDREVMLAQLLRPRLEEFESAHWRQATSGALTERQIEILAHVAEGLTNRQIATRLALSEGTVRRHLENVYARIGAPNRAAAAAHFLRTAQSAGSGFDPRVAHPLAPAWRTSGQR